MSTPDDLDSLPSVADVVIVGARAAGASTALLLTRAGLAVVLVDDERPGADTLSTHALMRGGVLQLSRCGVLDAVAAAGTPAILQTTFHYTHDRVTVAIKPTPGVDALYAPRRTVLDPILVDAARDAGAVVRRRVRVTALERDACGTVTGVHLRGPDRTDRVIRCDLVVGADGRRSTVAREVRAPTTRSVRHTSAFSYGYWAGLDAAGYEWAYRPDATAGFVPTNGGLTCVFAGASPTRIGRGGAGVLDAVLAEASGDMVARLRRARLASPVRTFVGQPGYLRRPWGAGWALVGDAGSWKDPISAHGLTDALRDAELLARAIVEWFGEGGTAGFAAYAETRDLLTVPMLDLSDEIAALTWDDVRIVDLLRELNAVMSEEVRLIEAFPMPVAGPDSVRMPTQRPA